MFGKQLLLGISIGLTFGVCIGLQIVSNQVPPSNTLRHEDIQWVWDTNNSDPAYWKKWSDQRTRMVDEGIGHKHMHNYDVQPGFPLTAEEYLQKLKQQTRVGEPYFLHADRLNEQEYGKINQHFLDQYPIVSLQNRLQYEDEPGKLALHTERHQYDLVATTAALMHDWNLIYNESESGVSENATILRGRPQRALEILHSEGLHAFANVMTGFGFYRLREITHWDLFAEDELHVTTELPDSSDPKYPSFYDFDSEYDLYNGSKINLREKYPEGMHKAFYFQFTDDNAFVKRFRQAAGFKPHRVSDAVNWHFIQYAPSKKPLWQVQRMELVSLLKHEKPAVYVSKILPDMTQLADGETRDLDEFEAQALEKIYRGEFIVTQECDQQLRMLGAMRAGESCMECHAVKQGQLLGAFSYVLQHPDRKVVRPEPIDDKLATTIEDSH